MSDHTNINNPLIKATSVSMGYSASILVKTHKKGEYGSQYLDINTVLPQMVKEFFEKEKAAIKEELKQELLKEIDARLGGLLSQKALTVQEVDALKYTARISLL